MSGKGDATRPCQVSQETWATNWDLIFKKKRKPKVKKAKKKKAI